MKNALLFLLAMTSLLCCQAVQWMRTYHNDIDPGGWDIGYRLFEVDDGGFLVLARTDWVEWPGCIVHYPFFIIKTDELGNSIAKRMYCDSIGAIYGAFELAEDTIVVFHPLCVLSINQEGDSIFSNSISLASYPRHPTGGPATISDEGYWIFCCSVLPDSGSAIELHELTLAGEILSTREYFPFGEYFDNNVIPCFISETRDNGFIISGTTLFGHLSWVVKINSDGDTLWITYPPSCTIMNSIVETAPNEFLCLGIAGYCHFFVCKIIGDGVISWSRYWMYDYAETSHAYAYSLIPTFDGNFVFCGSTGGYIGDEGGNDGCLIKIDSLSNVIWQRRVDIAGRPDFFYSVIQTQDSGYVCTGYASVCTDPESTMCESLEVCLVKFSKDGDIIWENSMKIPQKLSLSVYPNPFNSSCAISAPSNAKIEIFDINGKCVWQTPCGSDRSKPLSPLARGTDTDGRQGVVWSPDEKIPSGVYLIRATAKDGQSATKRIVFMK